MTEMVQLTTDQLIALYGLNTMILVVAVLQIICTVLWGRWEAEDANLTPEELDARRVESHRRRRQRRK